MSIRNTCHCYNILPDVGSSKKMTLGIVSSCNAITNLLFCPPLSPGPEAPPTFVSWTERRPV